MRSIKPMEIGLSFWADENPGIVLRQLDAVGISCGQLGVPPKLDWEDVEDDWTNYLSEWNVGVRMPHALMWAKII